MQTRTKERLFNDTMPPDSGQVNAAEEVSLADLWLIVRRRWLWMVTGLIVGVSVATAYIVFTIPTYESRISIRVGNVPGLALIEDLGVLSVELTDEYGPSSADGVRQRLPYLEKKGIKAKNNVLELAAVGYSPEEVRDFLRRIAAKIVQRHEQSYANAIDPLLRRLAAVDGQIGLLTAQLKELGDLVARLKQSNTVQASLVAIERGHLFNNLDELERDRVKLQQQVTKPYSNPSQVIARPELPKTPASPRKLVAAVLGIVLGLLLGLVAIFFREFFANVKDAARADARSKQEELQQQG